jgi:hypothetical protein
LALYDQRFRSACLEERWPGVQVYEGVQDWLEFFDAVEMGFDDFRWGKTF